MDDSGKKRQSCKPIHGAVVILRTRAVADGSRSIMNFRVKDAFVPVRHSRVLYFL